MNGILIFLKKHIVFQNLGKKLNWTRTRVGLLRTTAALAMVGAGSMMVTGLFSRQKQRAQNRRFNSPYIAKRV